MKGPLDRLLDSVTALASNTHLHVRLEGWSATAAIGVVCGTAIAVASIVASVRKH